MLKFIPTWFGAEVDPKRMSLKAGVYITLYHVKVTVIPTDEERWIGVRDAGVLEPNKVIKNLRARVLNGDLVSFFEGCLLIIWRCLYMWESAAVKLQKCKKTYKMVCIDCSANAVNPTKRKYGVLNHWKQRGALEVPHGNKIRTLYAKKISQERSRDENGSKIDHHHFTSNAIMYAEPIFKMLWIFWVTHWRKFSL